MTLAEHETLTLLDGDGTWILRGPGVRRLRARSAASSDALHRIADRRRVEIAGVRASEFASGRQNSQLWAITPTTGGNFCIAAGMTPRISATGGAPVRGILRVTLVLKTASVTGAIARNSEEWPQSVELIDKAEYLVSDDYGALSRIRLHIISGSLDLVQLAEAFSLNDCVSQLEAITE